MERYGERFIDTRTRSKIINQRLSSESEIFINFLKQFSLKCRSKEWRNLPESFNKRELKLLGYQAQNSQYSNLHKRMV